MTLPRSRALWALVVLGVAVRLAIAFGTYGHRFDVDSFGIVRDALGQDLLGVYSAVTFDVGGGIEQLRWPYPPAFFAWIAASGALEDGLGLPLHGLIQLPAIFADAAIAVLVYVWLRHRGATDRVGLTAAALVALGPSFLAVSGYHGQIDSLAILPAVAALIVWELRGHRRALAAGLLIGTGAALKTVPILLLLALLPTVRGWREAGVLVAAAAAVPLLLLAPFLITDPDGALSVAGYSGVPGVAGLSLVLQPDLAGDWLVGAAPALSSASEALYDIGGLIPMVALGATALFLLRFRAPALHAAVFVWLVVYAFSPNLFIHYAVWGLPFLLLAGYVRAVIVLEAVLVIPTVIVYAIPWSSDDVALVYAPIVIGLWLAAVAGVAHVAGRIARGDDAGRGDDPGQDPALAARLPSSTAA